MIGKDRIRPRRIDNTHRPQRLARNGDQLAPIGGLRPKGRFSISDQVNHGGRRRNPLRHRLPPQQRVDHRRFSRIEFTDDNDQERIVERVNRVLQDGQLCRGKRLNRADFQPDSSARRGPAG